MEFFSVGEILHENCPFEMLEEFLDQIEEHGYIHSPFIKNSRMPSEPMGEIEVLFDKAELAGGSYVELSTQPYDGTVGRDDSAFVAEHVFMPYKLLLLGLVDLDTVMKADAVTLTGEAIHLFAERIRDFVEAVDTEEHFTAALTNHTGVTAYAPPPHAEEMLNLITVVCNDEFVEASNDLADWIDDRFEDECLTIIW
jgi:hypothetical protein